MEILIDLTNMKAEKPQLKRKAQPSLSKNSKQCKIENDNIENFNFEIEEQKMTFKEHELQLKAQEDAIRKALAKAETLELANLEKKGFRITLKKIL